MKKLLVLYSTAYSTNADYGRRTALIQERLGADYQVDRAALLDLEFHIEDSRLRVTTTDDYDLKQADAVFFARWRAYENAFAAATYLHEHGVAFKPQQVLQLPANTKLGEHALLAGGEVALPPTVITSAANIKRHTYRYIQDFHEPVILKKADASLGKDNFLICRYREIFEHLAVYKDHDTFIIQKFIPNHEDYRVLVFNGRAEVVIKRARQDDSTHLNNTKQGARGSEVELTPELKRVAEAAARLTRRDELAGVDIVIDETDGTHYVLEVNKMPVLINFPLRAHKIDAVIDFLRSI